MNQYQFSVSMCVYGGDNPTHFDSAVKSILNQTLPPDEVVLVVDGPVPEELNSIITTYETNPLFHVLRLEENVGHGNARRIGLEACKYEYIALMDADDISIPERFFMQIEAFKRLNTVSIVGGQIFEFINDTSNIVGQRIVPETDKEIKEYIKDRCPMNQVTVMFKKKDVEEVGGYIDWYCEEDYYLWLRLYLANKQFYNIQENLVYVRVGEEMYQRRGGWKYFISEAKLQKYMHEHKIISFFTYIKNVMIRFIVQVLLPNKVRGWVFQTFARN